ncbi:S-methyl-5'-thioadenosine phosphorylase-like [Teleopsis dalmanni]|uniref:S-methyl-5'-thioadenosine phosphorylase-like n=1 Tax=Teleopsis dalmanni TaxID=139649 RepID=UPI0018CEEB0E|nr:S-methyl-5'-thioadenosine phosphorylase-like [Teleopsis dalmanni]
MSFGHDILFGKNAVRNPKIIPIKIGLMGIDLINEMDFRRRIFMNTPYGNPSDVIFDGEIENIPCILMPHLSRLTVLAPYKNSHADIWAFNNLGVTHIIASYPCSSLQETMYPGDVISPDNVINNTAWANRIDFNGVQSFRCHMPMSPPFNDYLRNVIIDAGAQVNIPVINYGTVLAIQGPRWPTTAECSIYRTWKADLLTTTKLVPEATLSLHAGILFAPLAVVTNYAKWGEVNGNKILDIYDNFLPNVVKVALRTIKIISDVSWADEITKNRNRASIVVGSDFQFTFEEFAIPKRKI